MSNENQGDRFLTTDRVSKVVSWIEKEMVFHREQKEKHLHGESAQAYQFHAGHWKALSEVYGKLSKLTASTKEKGEQFMLEKPELDEQEEMYCEYDQLTERGWVDYEFATIAYDYQIHPEAVDRIKLLFDRLESALQGLY